MSNSMDYMELLRDVQFAPTFVPTAEITAIAATTINPAMRAYSNTSPPRSSMAILANNARRVRISRLLLFGHCDRFGPARTAVTDNKSFIGGLMHLLDSRNAMMPTGTDYRAVGSGNRMLCGRAREGARPGLIRRVY